MPFSVIFILKISPIENSDENLKLMNANSDNNLTQKDKNENENKKEDNDMKVNNHILPLFHFFFLLNILHQIAINHSI